MWRALAITAAVLVIGVVLARTVLAQNPAMPAHGSMHQHMTAATPDRAPSQPGQAAFGAIAEIVRMLDADPATDWSKVDLERLRQHLIDMDDVLMRSEVRQAPIASGIMLEITGTGRTEQAIRRMIPAHAGELDRLPAYSAKAEPVAGGVRLTVTAKNPGDGKTVERVRGLGFAGLLTEGGHHGPHHFAMAKGEALDHHRH